MVVLTHVGKELSQAAAEAGRGSSREMDALRRTREAQLQQHRYSGDGGRHRGSDWASVARRVAAAPCGPRTRRQVHPDLAWRGAASVDLHQPVAGGGAGAIARDAAHSGELRAWRGGCIGVGTWRWRQAAARRTRRHMGGGNSSRLQLQALAASGPSPAECLLAWGGTGLQEGAGG